MNHSKQRDEIMEYLMGVKCHPTAGEIYDNVRLVDPTISRGTVYRNLDQLVSNGMVLKLSFGQGIDHYDADTSDHIHFVCRTCERVYDMPTSEMLKVRHSKDGENFDGKIEGHFGYFYGVCGSCLKAGK